MSSVRLIGASGIVIILAPSPVSESVELPLTFVAETFTSILVLKLSEYGADVNTD